MWLIQISTQCVKSSSFNSISSLFIYFLFLFFFKIVILNRILHPIMNGHWTCNNLTSFSFKYEWVCRDNNHLKPNKNYKSQTQTSSNANDQIQMLNGLDSTLIFLLFTPNWICSDLLFTSTAGVVSSGRHCGLPHRLLLKCFCIPEHTQKKKKKSTESQELCFSNTDS